MKTSTTDCNEKVIEAIEALQLNFRLSSAVKYIANSVSVVSMDDPVESYVLNLKTAIWFINREIDKVLLADSELI